MKNRVISFSSGKGGVGKTTLVANLGKLWSQAGKRTLLVDGDWNLGKLGITLGARPQWTVENVLSGATTLAQAIHPISPNLSLLASPSGALGFEEMDAAARNQIFFEIEASAHGYDVLLFDHGSGVNWNVLQFAAASHQHVIVTTPEPTSYTDAYAIMKLLSRRFAVRHFWLLVTMSQNGVETEGIISRFSDVVRDHLDVRVSLLDIMPWESKLAESIRRQRPYVEWEPDTKLTRQFRGICERLETSSPDLSHGLKFFYGTDETSSPQEEKCQPR